jgi:mannose-6-phosphate isomerase-like protein (cupin superfamily)
MNPAPSGSYGRTHQQPVNLEEMGQMPKVSRESASKVVDMGAAEDRGDELDGYAVTFVTIRQDADLAPMLKGLPDDKCQCPHWGYVFAGTLTWRYADREEVCEAGEAYYAPPGHTPSATMGSEFLQISPAQELRTVEAAIKKNMQAMQGA